MMTIEEIRAMAKAMLGDDCVSVKEFPDGGCEVRWAYSGVVQLPLPHRIERNPAYVSTELQALREMLEERLAFFANDLKVRSR